jgi:uncharacterized protein involved in outer membrane biogenesis
MPFLTFKQFPLLHKRTVRRLLAGFAISLLLFSVFGFLILPQLIQSQVETIFEDKFDRRASVGAVEVNPFAMTVMLRDFKLMERKEDRTAAEEKIFAGFDLLKLNLSLQSAWRFAPVVQEARLTRPYAHLVRKDANRYNIDDIVELINSQPPSDEPARFSINNIQIEAGRIDFEDRPAHASHTVTDIALDLPFVSSLPAQVHVFVEPRLSAKINGTPLLVQGKARPFTQAKEAVVALNLRDLDLTRYLGYLPFKPHFKLPSARFDANITASFRQPSEGAPALLLNGGLTLKALQLEELNGKPLLKLSELEAEFRDTDVLSRHLELARLRLSGLDASVKRGTNGVLNVLDVLPRPAQAVTGANPAKEPHALHLELGELEVQDASLRYNDERAAPALHVGVTKLGLTLRKLAVDTGKSTIAIGELASGNAVLLVRQNKAATPVQHAMHMPAADAAARTGGANNTSNTSGTADAADEPYSVSLDRVTIDNWSARIEDHSQASPVITLVEPISLSLQDMSTTSSTPARMAFKAAVNKTGQINMVGSLGLAPLQTDLKVDMESVDLLPLQPLITDRINLRISRANLSGNGRLLLERAQDGVLKGGFKGDVKIGNLAAVDKQSGNDFVRWKSLSAGGMDMRLEPFALTVDKLAVANFFSRVIIDSSGRINLQDIVRDPVAGQKNQADTNANASARANTAAALTAMPPISIGKLTLQGGNVRFTDNFIRPNYTAMLSKFGGVVSGLSSDPSSRANVELHGEVNNAPLSVAGHINPLKKDLSMDLKANVRGMELAPLSAYSSKYAGYGIEKGKLSFEVAYRIQDRRLSAENRLILQQLTFGDKVDSPAATTLPVRLAVALLSDRNGVIDINLPVEGSLDDPQFSVGGVILKVIGNVIMKAVTQPFALLGAALGGDGGEELSSIELEPGRFAISPAAESKLASLAAALAERPTLQLEIAGRVDPDQDRAGLKRATIERKVRTLKIKDLAARGEAVAPGSVIVSASEYPALLARVYKEETFDKPRNLLGLVKNLPVEEMEKLMIANVDIDDDDLLNLGNQRAQAAKNWLIQNGKVPEGRIFILASKIGKPEAADSGSGAAGSRVDFSLR